MLIENFFTFIEILVTNCMHFPSFIKIMDYRGIKKERLNGNKLKLKNESFHQKRCII
jgi:hypothetical protein